MGRKRWVGWSAVLVLAGLGVLAACVSSPRPGGSNEDHTSSISEALASSPNLLLQEETASCVANQALDFLEVTNNGTAAVKVSDISIKLWVDDTTAQSIVGGINYGGCLTTAAGACTHPVTGVAISATHFTPACGTDPTHQADWEVKISSTDTSTLAPGSTWANIQSTIHLANFANFSPGTADWYSPCVSGSKFFADGHFAVYVAGALVTASPGVPPSCRATTGTTVLTGEVPTGLGTTFPLVGPLPGATIINLSIGLPLNSTPTGKTALSDFVQQVSTPGSSMYRRYMNAATFASTYGGNASDYAALQTYVTANGLTVTSKHTSDAVLGVSGTAAAIENAFFVTLNVYQRPDGTTFYAPANAPSLTLTLQTSILHIAGFDDFAVPIPASGTSFEKCANVPSYFGADLRNTYLGAGASSCDPSTFGCGQTVGLLAFGSYVPANVLHYVSGDATNLGAPIPNMPYATPSSTAPTTLTNFGFVALPVAAPPLTPGVFLNAPAPTTGQPAYENETELGMEMLIAMAPQASVVVYVDQGGAQPPNNDLAAMADAVVSPASTNNCTQNAALNPTPNFNAPPQVLVSAWTWANTAGIVDPTIAQTFQQFAAQGQTFVQAAGDFGSYVAATNVAAQAVPHPISDSALMTVAGGTMFNGGATELVWNNTTEQASVTGSSCTPTATGLPVNVELNGNCNSVTGGGKVPSLTKPQYQTSSSSVYLGTSDPNITGSTTRMIPDVSILADDLAATVGGQLQNCAHGTSASAALWGGYIAVANAVVTGEQLQGATIISPLTGFANPLLYSLNSSGNFTDISSGTNAYSSASTGQFSAAAGYDLASGLGSPSANCNVVTGLPVQACQTGSAITAVVNTSATTGATSLATVGSAVTVALPLGSYLETTTGIDIVPIELGGIGPPTGRSYNGTITAVAAGAAKQFQTSDAINTCAGSSSTQEVVCSSNGTNLYYLKLGSLPATGTNLTTTSGFSVTDLASTGAQEVFSGGPCSTCNVTVDPLHNLAYVSLTTGTAVGYQAFDLGVGPTATPTALSTFLATGLSATTEDVVVDPLRGLILSPSENEPFLDNTSTDVGNYQLINPTTNVVYNNPIVSGTGGTGSSNGVTITPGAILDSAAEDCSTGITLSTLEFTNQLLLLDLNQATFMAATSSWTAPSNVVNLTGLSPALDEFGATGASVVESNSHIAVLTSEFGGNGFVVAQLPTFPAAVGSKTTPTVTSYVVGAMPAAPDGSAWGFGEDPHTVTAYLSPNDGRAYAIFQDDAALTNPKGFLAIVDLQAILTAPATNSVLNSAPTTCATTGQVSTTTGTNGCSNVAGCTCMVRFVAAP